jgi:hypothetical protein
MSIFHKSVLLITDYSLLITIYNTNSKLQRSVIFIETSQTKTLAPAERHIQNQLEDYKIENITNPESLVATTNREYYLNGYLKGYLT